MMMAPTSKSCNAKTPRPFPRLGRTVYTSGGPRQVESEDGHDIILEESDLEQIGAVEVAGPARAKDTRDVERKRMTLWIILRFRVIHTKKHTTLPIIILGGL